MWRHLILGSVLFCVSAFLPVAYCFLSCHFVVWFEVRKRSTSDLVLFVGTALRGVSVMPQPVGGWLVLCL